MHDPLEPADHVPPPPPTDLRGSARGAASAAAPRASENPVLFLPLGDEVLQRLNHEARTPLTVILSTTESLLDGGFGTLNTAQVNATLLVQAAGHRLLHMIEDVIVYVRLRAARHETNFQRVSTQAILDGALRSARTLIRDRQTNIHVVPLAVPGGIVCDEGLLQRALAHLIDNAIKFNRSDGTCTVEASVLGGLLQLRVSDDGPGIDERDRERVFTPFLQLSLHPDRRHRGVGLGLALVREIAALHGGRAWVEASPAGGCTACIEIPLRNTVAET